MSLAAGGTALSSALIRNSSSAGPEKVGSIRSCRFAAICSPCPKGKPARRQPCPHSIPGEPAFGEVGNASFAAMVEAASNRWGEA
jgi:hypothetical protein